MRNPTEILEICREAWREAARKGTNQSTMFSLPLGQAKTFCAASLVEETCAGLKLITTTEYWLLKFHCPEHPVRVHLLPHFNDVHGWDWLTLATKLGVEPYTLQE